MPLLKTDPFRATAIVALTSLAACSSGGTSSPPLVRPPKTVEAPPAASSTSFAVTVVNDDAPDGNATSNGKLHVMNGAHIDIVVTGAPEAAGGYVDALGKRISLDRRADGSWHAALQYVDELNPPPADPSLDVGMQFAGSTETVKHIPIVEMHD